MVLMYSGGNNNTIKLNYYQYECNNTNIFFCPSWIRMQFPHKMVNVDGQVDSEVKSLFKSLKSGLVRVGDVGWTMGEPYSKHASDLYNMTIRPNDVWLVTYPKSGKSFQAIYVNRHVQSRVIICR